MCQHPDCAKPASALVVTAAATVGACREHADEIERGDRYPEWLLDVGREEAAR